MKLAESSNSLVRIEGLDGCGKSQTAIEAAQKLSEFYPKSKIGVSDSTGLSVYTQGELIIHTYKNIERLEPRKDQSALGKIAYLGAFTLGRRIADYNGIRQTDLLIGVRDPHRIEPAAYSAVYSQAMRKIPPLRRLKIFDRLTDAPYADTLIRLHASAGAVQENIHKRAAVDPHETAEKLTVIAEELPLILGGYAKLFGSKLHEVEGLCTDTTDSVAESIEPLLGSGRILMPMSNPFALGDFRRAS